MYIHIYMHICIYMYICIHVYMYIYIYMIIYVYIYVCLCIMYIYMYNICIYICIMCTPFDMRMDKSSPFLTTQKRRNGSSARPGLPRASGRGELRTREDLLENCSWWEVRSHCILDDSRSRTKYNSSSCMLMYVIYHSLRLLDLLGLPLR